jgi:hypothetical protein
LLVGSGGSGSVLVDDDLALALIRILILALGQKTRHENHGCNWDKTPESAQPHARTSEFMSFLI